MTAAVKEAILNAFEKVGGEEYLVSVAREDPKTFCALLGRVLPREMRAELTIDHETMLERMQRGMARVQEEQSALDRPN